MKASMPIAADSNARTSHSRQIAVVGGGLAGLTAAIEAAQHAPQGQLSILVLDKERKLGGNSMKASSGISALTPDSGDSLDAFMQDTLTSGGGLSDPALVTVLVEGSGEALHWLQSHGVDLSKVAQLGGHSRRRTHANAAGPNVGYAIMSQLISRAQATPGIKIATGAKAEEILTVGGRVAGLRYSVTEEGAGSRTEEVPADAVVIATGGFGASPEALREFCPAVAAFATTSGPFAQGDGLALGQQAGASLVHMDRVQLHPTGFIDPKDPESGTKILAPEALRGCGAVLLNAEGRRFVDELQRRDVVAQAILRQPGGQAFLVLGQAGAEAFGMDRLGFYCSKGLAKKVDGVAGLAAHTGIPASQLQLELAAYNAAAAAGSNGGGNGANPDPFGKTVFSTGPISPEGPLYVMRVAPVVHYTMGGLAISPQAEVLDSAGAAIPGLYAAGEVTGGLHGANRLAGNSLLDCVVFGRRAGAAAAAHALAL